MLSEVDPRALTGSPDVCLVTRIARPPLQPSVPRSAQDSVAGDSGWRGGVIRLAGDDQRVAAASSGGDPGLEAPSVSGVGGSAGDDQRVEGRRIYPVKAAPPSRAAPRALRGSVAAAVQRYDAVQRAGGAKREREPDPSLPPRRRHMAREVDTPSVGRAHAVGRARAQITL